MKVIKAYNKIQKLQPDPLPYNVWTTFYERETSIQISGNLICLGSDYKSLEEVRDSLKYLVDQFGGEVQWT